MHANQTHACTSFHKFHDIILLIHVALPTCLIAEDMSVCTCMYVHVYLVIYVYTYTVYTRTHIRNNSLPQDVSGFRGVLVCCGEGVASFGGFAHVGVSDFVGVACFVGVSAGCAGGGVAVLRT